MKFSFFLTLYALILSPYLFSVDSSYTDVIVGAGGGQYTYHDCHGIQKEEYADAGASITHKFKYPLRIGVNTAFTTKFMKRENNFLSTMLIIPDIAFDSKYFALGISSLRIGERDKVYLDASFGYESVPLFSGKGVLHTGLGFTPPQSSSHFWFGLNAFPYERWGLAGSTEFPLGNNKFLLTSVRYNNSNKFPEYGFSLGLRFRSNK